VGGWGPDQYLIQEQKSFDDGDRIDLVLVSIYLENDILDLWRTRIPARTPAQVHALRMPRSLKKSELIDAVAYPINDFLEVRSQFFMLFKNRMESIRMTLGLTDADMERVYYRWYATAPAWSTTASICAEINAVAARHGVPALFVMIPASFQVDTTILRQYERGFRLKMADIDLGQPNRVLGDSLRARGLSVVDATSALRDAFHSGLKPFGQVDRHLSPAGHEAVARLLEPKILELLSPGTR
jgi:hypothetical protein